MRFSRLAGLAGAAYLLSAIPCIAPVRAQTPQAGTAPLSAAQEGALKAGDAFQECTNCPVMMVVPAGSFTMGSPANEPDRELDEGLQHKVTLARQFAVGQYELTFDQWDACVADGGCNGYKPSDAGWGSGTRPVINVSWNDANAYVAWLAKKTGKPYRLLSESEYEYATRAGTTTVFPWGDEIKLNGQPMANCDGCGSQWGAKQTAPVGSFPPNKFGLYDMVGNVWEWAEDCYHPDYNGAPTDGSAWASGDCIERILRGGGSWSEHPWDLRSASRFKWYDPDVRDDHMGFRVGRTIGPAALATPAPVAPTPITVSALSATQEQALKPKETLQECSKCPVMIVVPAGSFTMGSPANEPDRALNEGPQHKVTIAAQFAVGQYELTFDQWDACVADGGCNGYKPSDAGWGSGTRPVINVSWNDANAYVAWLAKKTGKPYRLLSEAEYEYATRAGTTTAYPWGDAVGKDNANCRDCGTEWDMTTPVGSFPPNNFGLYDMVGNVWEWTQDCYHTSYNGAPTDGSAWASDCSQVFKYNPYYPFDPSHATLVKGYVTRGGYDGSLGFAVRSASRVAVPANSTFIGFRVARTLTGP